MKYKTRKDIDRLIALNKPSKVIEGAITSYLTGAALQPIIKAEARHAELKAHPDQPDVEPITEERQVLVQAAVYEGPDADGNYTEVSPAQYTTETVTMSEGYSPNAIRDAELADLVLQYPHLADDSLERPAPQIDTVLQGQLVVAACKAKMQQHLDALANAYSMDNIHNIGKFRGNATSRGAISAALGQYADDYWQAGDALLAAGHLLSIDEVMAQLPAFEEPTV